MEVEVMSQLLRDSALFITAIVALLKVVGRKRR
jgi:hypothetical protein